jgi:hypothetical protein
MNNPLHPANLCSQPRLQAMSRSGRFQGPQRGFQTLFALSRSGIRFLVNYITILVGRII